MALLAKWKKFDAQSLAVIKKISVRQLQSSYTWMMSVAAVVRAKLSRVNTTAAGVLTAKFRQLRLHKCGLWNRTIARTFRQGRHSLLMTAYTTVNCSTNYIRQVDEGAEYFIAIRRPWKFHEYNYNLRRGDKLIRRRRWSSWFSIVLRVEPSALTIFHLLILILVIFLFVISHFLSLCCFRRNNSLAAIADCSFTLFTWISKPKVLARLCSEISCNAK